MRLRVGRLSQKYLASKLCASAFLKRVTEESVSARNVINSVPQDFDPTVWFMALPRTWAVGPSTNQLEKRGKEEGCVLELTARVRL